MVLIRVAALVPFLAVTHARSGSIRGASPIDLAEETTTRESLYDELLGLDEFAEDEIEFAEEDGNYGSFDYLLNTGHEDNGILLAEETTTRESLYDELGLGEFAEDEIEFAEDEIEFAEDEIEFAEEDGNYDY